MEYLQDFDQELNSYPSSQWDFYDLSKLGDYIFGAPLFSRGEEEVVLKKVQDVDSILKDGGESSRKWFVTYNEHTCGVRLRFSTDSDSIVIKAQIGRIWAYNNINMYNSSGFDLYCGNENDIQRHITTIAPIEGEKIFAHSAIIKPNRTITIFFPTYNKVERLAIGVKKNKSIFKCKDYAIEKPILIYGNSRTQGASACRSGNAFMNIVSRKLDCDIINYSFSYACRGQKAMAELIAKHNMSAFVMDYNQNAATLEDLQATFYPFYEVIRKMHNEIPIIIIGGYNTQKYNDHIFQVYLELKNKGDCVYYIDPKILFLHLDDLSFSIDGAHFMDEGNFVLANRIIAILEPLLN